MEQRKPDRKLKTGKFCVVYGCSNTHADGVSLHHFPPSSKPALRRQWVNFVKTKRRDFLVPSPNSVICEQHFSDDCYPAEYRLKRTMKIPILRKSLLPDAVPTIQSASVGALATADPPKRSAFRKRAMNRLSLMEQNTEIIIKENETAPMEESPNLEEEEPVNRSTVGVQCSGRKPERRSVKVQIRPKLVDAATQCNFSPKPKTASVGIQCNRYLDTTTPLPICQVPPQSSPELEEEQLDDDPMLFTDDTINDLDYQPDSDDMSSDDEIDEMDSKDNVQGKYYIVSQLQLMKLFECCPMCMTPSMATVKQIGTLCKVHQTCGVCNFDREWESQPSVGNTPEGNLLMSAAILFSGSIPSKALRFLDHMNVATISKDTFHRHQRLYLHPAIANTWSYFQTKYIDDMRRRQEPLTLGGDGRADTPGHSAKFGSYGMLDLNLMMVVDIQLVQSNEVKNSSNMEKEGFIRSTNFFKENGLTIGEVVTDRHVQIVKYVREEMQDTIHHFDVWHVAKGLKKKLVALSKEKECESLLPWVKSICNHLYWVAASTPDGNGDLMLEKWESVGNHIQDKHNHDGKLFERCQHSQLEGRERQKKWLKAGTKVCEKLQDIITSRQMKKDIPKLSPGPQTAALEGFHSVINHFAPKMIGFSYHGMLSRITLAALHFNENGMREQATTRDGSKRFSIVFPKYKKGTYTVKEVKTECTYEYVDQLMDTVLKIADNSEMSNENVPLPLRQAPPALCSTYDRPNKEEAVREFMSRYHAK